MKKIWYSLFVVALLVTTVSHVQAAVISSQEDSSGAPSHYWSSDGSTGSFLVTDPNGGAPGYSIGIIGTSTNVVGIHIKAQFNTDGAFNVLPRIPILFDESGAQPFTCAQLPFGGNAYGNASDALTLQNPLQYSDFNAKMVDMYFQCDLGTGHNQVYSATSYRLFFSPISTADVSDIFVAMNAAGDKPFYEISDDGTYPPAAPPISISLPAQGGTYSSSDSIVPLATIANLASYSSVVYLLNGVAIDPTQPLPIASLPFGMATLVIAATDNLGNTTFATSTFTIADRQPPTITIVSPLNGHSYLQNDVASINATITDNSGVATTTYLLNGTTVDPTQMLPFMSQSLGTQTLVVSAYDIYGNLAYATSTFTLLPPDLTPPSINITNPTAGATYFDTASVLAAATVTDASPIVATTYTFNGTTIDPTLSLPLLGSPLGPATLSVAATDKYGNAASSSVTFTIKSSDITPPSITITNPIAGHRYAATSSVFAVATVSDASGVATTTYVLGGITINPLQALPFNLVGAGTTTLVVTAIDVFGNVGSSSVSFNVSSSTPVINPDTTGPQIAIISPYPGKKYSRNDSVFVVATITDTSAIANVRYFFNGVQIDPTKALQLSKAPLGTATLKIIATDIFGNTSSATSTFRILPGSNSCIADITEAFDHKWIANKNVFKAVFEDCQKINDRGNDRDNYDNDDHKKNKDHNQDDRYLKAQKDIDDSFDDIDHNINN